MRVIVRELLSHNNNDPKHTSTLLFNSIADNKRVENLT
jgi:hypothetical protein